MWQYIVAAAVSVTAVGFMPASAQAAESAQPVVASIEKEGDITQAVVLQGDKTQFRFHRSVWQAVSVRTPAGKQLRITDPLFYNTLINDKPAGNDAYWTKPENWDSQLTFQVIDRPDAPQGTATVLIEGRRPGLVKQVYVTQYPGESAVYVVNRVRVEEPANVQDVHLMYLARATDNTMHLSEMTLDETMVDPDTRANGRRGAFMYLGTSDTSLGVAVAPAGVQKSKVRDMLIHLPQKTGRELRIVGLTGQALKAGEEVEIRYALYWGDGHQLREVHAWIREVADGQRNDRFHPAPQAR